MYLNPLYQKIFMPWAQIQKVLTNKGRYNSNNGLKINLSLKKTTLKGPAPFRAHFPLNMWPTWSTQELGTECLNQSFV